MTGGSLDLSTNRQRILMLTCAQIVGVPFQPERDELLLRFGERSG